MRVWWQAIMNINLYILFGANWKKCSQILSLASIFKSLILPDWHLLIFFEHHYQAAHLCSSIDQLFGTTFNSMLKLFIQNSLHFFFLYRRCVWSSWTSVSIFSCIAFLSASKSCWACFLAAASTWIEHNLLDSFSFVLF